MLEIGSKSKKIQSAFSVLGENWEVRNNLFIMLEESVCQLYGYQNKSTDRVRFQIYDKKYIKQNKVNYMAALPPCISALQLHTLRSNMVASLRKFSTTASCPTYHNMGGTFMEISNGLKTFFQQMWRIYCYMKNMKTLMNI